MIRKTKNLLLLLVWVILFCSLSCKGSQEGTSAPSALPDVELKDLSGKTVRLKDFSGKAVIVNFWATWCHPCRAEIPMLNDLQKKYKDNGLEIIGISTDEDGAKAVKEFIKEVPIYYNNFLKYGETEEKFGGIWAYPTSFFYDRRGNKIDVVFGIQPREYFEKNIQRMLKN